MSAISPFPSPCASLSRAWVAKEDCSLGIFTAATVVAGAAAFSVREGVVGFEDVTGFEEVTGFAEVVRFAEVVIGSVEVIVFTGFVTASAVNLLPVSATGAAPATAGAGSVGVLEGLVVLPLPGVDDAA